MIIYYDKDTGEVFGHRNDNIRLKVPGKILNTIIVESWDTTNNFVNTANEPYTFEYKDFTVEE